MFVNAGKRENVRRKILPLHVRRMLINLLMRSTSRPALHREAVPSVFLMKGRVSPVILTTCI